MNNIQLEETIARYHSAHHPSEMRAMVDHATAVLAGSERGKRVMEALQILTAASCGGNLDSQNTRALITLIMAYFNGYPDTVRERVGHTLA